MAGTDVGRDRVPLPGGAKGMLFLCSLVEQIITTGDLYPQTLVDHGIKRERFESNPGGFGCHNEQG